ncbi:unnamed protein product, partial [Adineta steineri]
SWNRDYQTITYGNYGYGIYTQDVELHRNPYTGRLNVEREVDFTPIVNSTTTATCNFTACNSQRIACSSNPDCDCFSLTSNPNTGICASTIFSCSNFVRCNMYNITCSIESTICVNSTRCGQPICYPLPMANKQICPPKTVTSREDF